MHVVFVSQCEKKALKKTRAVLDGYAIRAGSGTWVTPVTEDGLTEIRRALRKTATRQTAVACYRNEGRSRLYLLWVVGNRSTFGPDGQVAVNTTKVSHRRHIPSWLKEVCLIAKAGGFAHDLGKYSTQFAEKLRMSEPVADPIRHEWLSMKLLPHLVEGKTWDKAWKSLAKFNDVGVFGSALGSAFDVVNFIVATHHKLPHREGTIVASNHVRNANLKPEPVAPLPSEARKQLIIALQRINRYENSDIKHWRGIALLARMALITADHTVSAENHVGEQRHKRAPAYANTREGKLNQALDWHLTAVGDAAAKKALALYTLELPGLSEQSKSRINEASTGKYLWQETAATALSRWPSAAPTLVFNLASTGAGKTRMNARAVTSLAGEGQVRFATLLNLKTLTLQTGDSYKNQLGIGADELVCVIGDRVAKKFYKESVPEDTDENEEEADYSVLGEGEPLPDSLRKMFESKQKLESVVTAPVAVCTIDFLINAGQLPKQGNHIAAAMRLMTSDLILDEIDSYDPKALIPVLRLVQMSAFFGKNIIASSATLSHPIAEALYRAFDSGLELRAAVRGEPKNGRFAIIDDKTSPVFEEASGLENFIREYRNYVTRVLGCLTSRTRIPVLATVDQKSGLKGWHAVIKQQVETLHANNRIQDPKTGRWLSFGVVRLANIKGVIPVARYLSRELPLAHVTAYHSQLFAVHRVHIERRLDELLTRKPKTKGGDPNWRILEDPEVRSHLDDGANHDLLYVVVASPVEEIGRDHDFDYGVIEPSSSASIVQMCGRIGRHRQEEKSLPNVAILQFNRNAVRYATGKYKEKLVFKMPGLETSQVPYGTMDMAELLDWSSLDKVDAGLRFGAHRLSQKDDESLRVSMERCLDILEGSPAVANLWMAETYYNDFRDHSPKQSWTYNVSEDVFLQLIKNKGKPPTYVNKEGTKVQRAEVVKGWLQPDIHELVSLAKGSGVSLDEAFSFKLPDYDKNESTAWTYYGGWGMVV